jgi:hypothetical protein
VGACTWCLRLVSAILIIAQYGNFMDSRTYSIFQYSEQQLSKQCDTYRHGKERNFLMTMTHTAHLNSEFIFYVYLQ